MPDVSGEGGGNKTTITVGTIMGFLVLVMYVNVSTLFGGDLTYATQVLSVYTLLLVFGLVVFNQSFPGVFKTPMAVLKFVVAFFVGGIMLSTLPKIPASLVGSVAMALTAKNSVFFIQTFLAGFIETIVLIYAIDRATNGDRMRRFWISNALFVFIHLGLIWSKVFDPAYAIYPWYITIGVSSVTLFILNSIFQYFYDIGGGWKKEGIEMAMAVHMVWDSFVWGILPFLFGAIIFAQP